MENLYNIQTNIHMLVEATFVNRVDLNISHKFLVRMARIIFIIAFIPILFISYNYFISYLQKSEGTRDEIYWLEKNVCGQSMEEWCRKDAIAIIRKENIIITSTNQFVNSPALYALAQKRMQIYNSEKQSYIEKTEELARLTKIQEAEENCKIQWSFNKIYGNSVDRRCFPR